MPLQRFFKRNWCNNNPNNVKREHFEAALEEAEMCQPEKGRSFADSPRVGVVIVKNGKPLVKVRRHEVGDGDHAEYIALKESGIPQLTLKGADLITTLEPCTAERRGAKKKPCVEWIHYSRIRKVWIGCLDRNPAITGQSIVYLRERGIAVGFFPDDLVEAARKQNADFFKSITSELPRLSRNDLEKRREEIGIHLKADLERIRVELKKPGIIEEAPWGERTILDYASPKARRWGGIISDLHEDGERVCDLLGKAQTSAISIGTEEADAWVGLADEILLAYEVGCNVFRGVTCNRFISSEKHKRYIASLPPKPPPPPEPGFPESGYDISFNIDPSAIGLAIIAYETATRLDSNNWKAWIGLATCKLRIDEHFAAYEHLERVAESLRKPDERIAGFYFSVINSFRIEEDYERALKGTLRALQFGIDAKLIKWQLTRTLDQSFDGTTSKLQQILEEIANLLVLQSGHQELAKLCLKKAHP